MIIPLFMAVFFFFSFHLNSIVLFGNWQLEHLYTRHVYFSFWLVQIDNKLNIHCRWTTTTHTQTNTNKNRITTKKLLNIYTNWITKTKYRKYNSFFCIYWIRSPLMHPPSIGHQTESKWKTNSLLGRMKQKKIGTRNVNTHTFYLFIYFSVVIFIVSV